MFNCILLLLAALLAHVQSVPAVQTTYRTDDPGFHPQRILVQFQPGAANEGKAFPRNPDLRIVPVPDGMDVSGAVAVYRRNPNVIFAEPDYKFEALETVPSDPLWSQQWDMVKIAASTAWNTQTDASDVVVAVIDTGVDRTHPDLTANTIPGWVCIGGSCVLGDGDDYGHGTHVAGTIGAVANNGIGIAGINWRASMLSIKFLDSTGSGYLSDAVLAFEKVLELKQSGLNIRVTNNSWGGGPFTQSLYDAMQQVEQAGILNVCAAGNSGQNTDQNPMYPAAYDLRGIVSVLATDSNDTAAYFTNYGLVATDISAPGVSTLSTVPMGTCPLCDASGYKLLSGTSMASPHVAGVAAALFHRYPSLSAAQARDVILDPASYDVVLGNAGKSTSGGRLNFAKMLTNPRLPNPVLNQFPVISSSSNQLVGGGDTVSISTSVTDPDGDPLRQAVGPLHRFSGFYDLINYWLERGFPSLERFTAPALAYQATVGYGLEASDGRGGGAQATSYVTVTPSSNGGVPHGAFSISNPTPVEGEVVTLSYNPIDPEGGVVPYNLSYGGTYSGGFGCCYFVPTLTSTFGAGVYRIGVQSMDQELNLSTRETAVVKAGGATGEPPLAVLTIRNQTGVVPLSAEFDLSRSTDVDGGVSSYWFYCPSATEHISVRTGVDRCTFDKPGAHFVWLGVMDQQGYSDYVTTYVMAHPDSFGPPPPPPPVDPPQVQITYPVSGSTVTRKSTVSIQALAVAGSNPLSRVDFSVNGAVKCSDTMLPYSCVWKVPAAGGKIYQLRARVYDVVGATADSPIIAVTAR